MADWHGCGDTHYQNAHSAEHSVITTAESRARTEPLDQNGEEKGREGETAKKRPNPNSLTRSEAVVVCVSDV